MIRKGLFIKCNGGFYRKSGAWMESNLVFKILVGNSYFGLLVNGYIGVHRKFFGERGGAGGKFYH
jgi:hypothetical protein